MEKRREPSVCLPTSRIFLPSTKYKRASGKLMCALVVWIHHSQIKISEPRHRLQQCWQGSAHTHACTHARTPKRRKGPGAWRKSRLSVLAQQRWKMMSPCQETPWDNLGLGGHGCPSHAAPEMAAQPMALTVASAADPGGWRDPRVFLPSHPSAAMGDEGQSCGWRGKGQRKGILGWPGEQKLGTAREAE